LYDLHGQKKESGASQNSGVCPQGGEWTDLTVKPDSPLGKQGITTYPMPIGQTKSCPCARCDHSGNPYKADSGSVWRGQLLLAQDIIAPLMPKKPDGTPLWTKADIVGVVSQGDDGSVGDDDDDVEEDDDVDADGADGVDRGDGG